MGRLEEVTKLSIHFCFSVSSRGLTALSCHYCQYQGPPRRTQAGSLSYTAPYLHPEWNERAAAVKALPVPANFTTLGEGWDGGLESDRAHVQVPQELVMEGPWGLEPQTSTVSR